MTLTREIISKSVFQIAFISCLIFSSSISIAGIYKWVDENGMTHYGEQRPTDASSQQMEVQRYAPRDTATYKKPSLKSQTTDTKNTSSSPSESAEPEKKPETKAEKKRRLAACEQARSNLKRMQEIGRIRSVDKDGNTRYLSQAEKEAQMKQARDLIAKHCQ